MIFLDHFHANRLCGLVKDTGEDLKKSSQGCIKDKVLMCFKSSVKKVMIYLSDVLPNILFSHQAFEQTQEEEIRVRLDAVLQQQ